MSQFVGTTSFGSMRPVGSPAERSLPRIRAVLEREFPAGTGLELAEPVPRKDATGIDWYTERDEGLARLAGMPPEEAAAYKTRLYQAVQSVLHAAAAHDTIGTPAARATAAALRSSVTFPGDENVWISGAAGNGTIVLTAWGYESHGSQASGGSEIAESAQDRPPPPAREAAGPPSSGITEPPSVPPASGRPRWRAAAAILLLAVPLALALLMGWLLIPACGIRLPFGTITYGEGDGSRCLLAAPLPPPPDGDRVRTQELMSEAAVLEEQLQRSLDSCQSAEAVQPDALDEKVRERGGQSGKLQVTLEWYSLDDLDLLIACSGGLLLGSEGSEGPGVCGDGVKDVDSNRDLKENVTSDPVENIAWTADIPQGVYRFWVHPYAVTSDHETDDIPFRLRIKVDESEQNCNGTVKRGFAKYIVWQSGEPVPECSFRTESVTACTSNCKE